MPVVGPQIETPSGLVTGRTYWHSPQLDNMPPQSQDPEQYDWHDPNRREVPQTECNLVGSQAADGAHWPILDLDLPCRLEPSRTPGHYHLFIDRPITWELFVPILEALTAAGIVEQGFLKATLARQCAFARYTPPEPIVPSPFDEEPF